MKKNISILLVVIMILGILSGCEIRKNNTENQLEKTTQQKAPETTEKISSTQNSMEDIKTSESTQSTESNQPADNQQTIDKADKVVEHTFAVPSKNGKLHVSKDGKLCDEKGDVVQLRGVSTHGIAWYPQYVSTESFASLKQWGANVVRIAMYTYENGGYCTDGDKDKLKKIVKDGVKYAEENDMYAIIDWHVLNEGNPNTYSDQAKTFFAEMAKEFKDSKNVIYEICNEPCNGTKWGDVKFYASEVIPSIRDYDKTGVILIGTPNWSQDVDNAVSDPIIEYDNIMYTFHFYAATHKEDMQKKLKSAIDARLPVFVSEFGICDASGTGQIDIASADSWIKLLDDNDISYVCWNLSNKDESSALISKACEKTSSFTLDELSQQGQWLYYVLLQRMTAEVGNQQESESSEAGNQQESESPEVGNQ